jgi:hypothetical protein
MLGDLAIDMCKQRVKAEINWTPESEGGRKKVMPVGMRYCPVIVAKPLEITGSTWSVAIINKSIDGLFSTADLSFMSPDAPHETLTVGLEFDLYEGQNLVASGKIISY